MEKKFLWNLAGRGARRLNRLTFPLQKDSGTVIRFDPSLGTDNLGDCIIMQYCEKVLAELFPQHTFADIGTHLMPTGEQEQTVKGTKYKFVCGTNLLTSFVEEHWRWILPEGVRRKRNYRNVILLGVGWSEYQAPCSDYSRMIYRLMLNPGVLHSVRDQYTLTKLQQAGFQNVINTGCPTTWGLTPEFCREIPTGKAGEAVTTVTDYRRDPDRDNELLAILSRNYDRVYLWPQGNHDTEYLETLEVPANLTVLPASLEAYEQLLQRGGVDYVGTRLHAGIHALNHRIRSIILAVDNRAAEMGRDIHLPVIRRDAIGEELEKKIHSDFASQIRIDRENIDRFQSQFRRS